MSDSSEYKNSEEIASDEDSSDHRGEANKSLRNSMVKGKKKGRKGEDDAPTTGRQESEESKNNSDDSEKNKESHMYEDSNENEESDENNSSSNEHTESQQEESQSEFEIDGPVQLVKVSDDLTSFEVWEEGMKILKSIKDDIGVVSFAGAQRTGKSFALNMLLDKLGGKGFKVSSSTSSWTQGIWIWGKPVYVDSRKMYLILLDTEGSGSTDKNTTHDGKIFALVVLISSFFIYNSFGAIDESAINNLSLAAKLSTNIAVRAGNGISEEEVIANFTPKFLWLLRDFVLELKENGHKITENEYLESKLNNSTDVKSALIKFFKTRELMTMVRPVDDESKLANLNSLNYDKLRSQFRQKAEVLKNKVFNECPVKLMNNKRINGKVLAKLLSIYVDAINDGAVPNITSAWESVVDGEREKYYGRAKTTYSENIRSLKYPKEELDHLKLLFVYRQEAFKTLNEGFKLGDDHIDEKEQDIKVKELTLFIEKHERESYKANYQASRKYCENLVKSAFSSISSKLNNEGYTLSNMEDMQFDVNSFASAYIKQSIGPAKMEVFAEYMKSSIPKISKDVLTKEYTKQQENESRLNEAIKILQEKNKILEENLNEIEVEDENKQKALEDLETKLRKATQQEQKLLDRAKEETK